MSYGFIRWIFGWTAGFAAGLSIPMAAAGDRAAIPLIAMVIIAFFADCIFVTKRDTP